MPVINIGLINNASEAAFAGTIRLFRDLLDRSARGRAVHLHVATLPGTSGGTAAAEAGSWQRLARDVALDAVIVTGAEPSVGELQDEPFWEPLATFFRWAERNDMPLVLSCLAAHAAAWHFDGIRRVKLPRKRFGIFHHEVVGNDKLLRGLPTRIDVPHSRWNSLREDELSSGGFQTLTRADDASPDMFIRRQPALALYLQGHPEYGARTLLAEYRRDVGRYLSGRTATYPEIPAHMLCASALDAVERFRHAATHRPAGARLDEFPSFEDDALRPTAWRTAAATVFANWLDQVEDGSAASPDSAARPSVREEIAPRSRPGEHQLLDTGA